MSHRTRSKTADSTDAKKPRRLMEKIAIMKKREHEQLEEFQHAMQSIHEMQRARIHSGGGSMPSLQAIDSAPPAPSIDMQMVLQDYNEVTQAGSKSANSKDRPHSSGPSGRRGTVIHKTSSMDTDPYPTSGLNHSDHYWNASHSGDWMEGDLSRHKSDSDLQQSLMMQQQQLSPQHMPHPPHGSPQQQPRNHKLNPPPDLALWRRTNSASTAHALLSPDQYTGTPELPVPSPLGAGGTASSLPDLTNIEFSSGLEVPLEKDDPHPTHQTPVSSVGGLQQQIFMQQQQQQQLRGRSFFPPPPGPTAVNGPGPSKLVYTSLQHNPVPNNNPLFNNVHPSQFALPRYPAPAASASSGFQFPQGGLGMRPSTSPLTAFQAVPQPGITKSPTMPDFRSVNIIPPRQNVPHEYPFTRLKPILPTGLQDANTHAYNALGGLSFAQQTVDPLNHGASILPPMTIIIQPPGNAVQAGAVATTAATVTNSTQIRSKPHDPLQQALIQQQQQQNHIKSSPVSNLVSSPPVVTPSSQVSMNTYAAASNSPLTETPSSAPSKPHGAHNFAAANSSLPNTPTITISPGLNNMLPSYAEAKQQQALQQKFASINVGKAEALIRSHSEENLQQKIQKEKMELIQQNPFMGTLTNANSVPCVYVESQNMEQQLDGPDSPTNLDSPSTSASYASSPPSVRPFWLDHPNSLNEFVFHEWPLEAGSLAGGGTTGRAGSPPLHHRSLTDLIQSTIPELSEMDTGNRNKVLTHQLSLPSVAMTDLTMDEHFDRNTAGSPSDFLVPPGTDFDMEESVMELIKNEVPDLQSFDMSHIALHTDAGLVSQAEALLSPADTYH